MRTWKRAAAAMLLTTAAIVLGACSHTPIKPPVPPPVNKDWAITLNWNYDFTNFIKCSPTVTTGCITGFTVGYMQGTTQVALPNNTVPVTVCTGAVQPQPCQYSGNSQLPIGDITWFCVTNFVRNNGTTGTATATSAVPTKVDALSATNLNGNIS